MISLRLQEIAKLIPNDSKIINVGTDHALLEIYLAQTKNIKSIGIDISYPSVLKAKENVLKANLQDKITILHNDGLKNIDLKDEIVTISGLGTNTILNILKEVKNNDIIVQSNNNLFELRKELCKKGFYIYDEKVIYDKKWYVIIYFKKGKRIYNNFELYVGPKIFDKKYIDYLYKINLKKLSDIPKKKLFKRQKIKKILKKLKNCSE